MGFADIIKSWFKKDTPKPAPAPAASKAPPEAKAPIAPKTKPEAPSKPDNNSKNNDKANPKNKTDAKAKSKASKTTSTAQAKPKPTPAEPTKAKEVVVIDTGGNPLLDKVYNSPQLSISLMALTKIEDEQQLADIITQHKVAKVRQEAAARLTDMALITATADKIKHSDKGVYRVLRQKIDSTQAAHQTSLKHQQQLVKICADLEASNRQTANPLFAAKIQSLQQQWQNMTATHPAPEDVSQRYQQALSAVHAVLAQQQQTKHATEAAQQQQLAVIAQLQALLDSILQHDELPDPVQCQQHLNELRERWHNSLPHHTPSPEQASQELQLQKRLGALQTLVQNTAAQLEQLQQLVATAIATPDNAQNTLALKELLKPLTRTSELPPVLNHAQAVLVQAEKRLAAKTAEPKEPKVEKSPKAKTAADVPEFGELLQKIEHALAEGNSRHASQHLKNAQQLAKTHHLHEPRLAQWASELQQLKDWAGFAILPKKEALVERMRALAEVQTTDGLERLDEIKALQAEWQAVGMMNNDAEKGLWHQFKDLSQVAYQPCQRHFDEQKAIQDENARQREALCQELQHYLDNMPTEVNWQIHISILKKAREDWQKYHPVEQKTHKKLQARFNDILQGLEKKLHDEHDQQAARKQAIIVEAEKLLTLDDLRTACDQAKDLQHQWKATGTSGHARDQQLWEQFRAQCDAVFARRDSEKQARQQQEQAQIEQARTLLLELEQATAQDITPEQLQHVDTLCAALQALSLPRDIFQSTRQQLNTLRSNWHTRISSQQQQDILNRLTDVISAVTLCFNTENSVLAGHGVSEEYQANWQQLQLPSLFESTLNKRWQAIPQMTARSSHAGQFKASCLLIELLLDIPSPDSEKQARTAKKMHLFQLQSYPKTPEEKQTTILHLLQQVLGYSGLTLVEQADSIKRMTLILSSPELAAVL